MPPPDLPPLAPDRPAFWGVIPAATPPPWRRHLPAAVRRAAGDAGNAAWGRENLLGLVLVPAWLAAAGMLAAMAAAVTVPAVRNLITATFGGDADRGVAASVAVPAAAAGLAWLFRSRPRASPTAAFLLGAGLYRLAAWAAGTLVAFVTLEVTEELF